MNKSTRIEINICAQRLRYWENGALVMDVRVSTAKNGAFVAPRDEPQKAKRGRGVRRASEAKGRETEVDSHMDVRIVS